MSEQKRTSRQIIWDRALEYGWRRSRVNEYFRDQFTLARPGVNPETLVVDYARNGRVMRAVLDGATLFAENRDGVLDVLEQR